MKYGKSRHTDLTILLFSIVLCVGCNFQNPRCANQVIERVIPITTPSNVFVSRFYNEFRPSRIVIVMPQSRSQQFRDQDKFAEALANQLRSAGIVDSVVVGESNTNRYTGMYARYDERELVDLSQFYNADAVLYCDLTSVSAFAPMHLGVSLTMVDARESVVLMAMNSMWDLRERRTANSFRQHTIRSNSHNGISVDVMYQSPVEFFNFAAWEISQYLKMY